MSSYFFTDQMGDPFCKMWSIATVSFSLTESRSKVVFLDWANIEWYFLRV